MIGAESLAAEVKFLIFVLAVLLAIFLIVIYKIIKDTSLTAKQKWVLSLVTPISITFGLLVGNLTGERDIILFTLLILIIANLSYISKPITNFLISEFIYGGTNDAIRHGLFVLLSLLITVSELAGTFAIFVFIVKK